MEQKKMEKEVGTGVAQSFIGIIDSYLCVPNIAPRGLEHRSLGRGQII